jgi:hypothetical protein
MSDANTPVAKVLSWTSGSYWRNYKLQWLRDVPEGTELYAAVPAELAAIRASRDALAMELREVLEWARTEAAPLREQEMQSIRRVLAEHAKKGEAS